MPSSLFADGSVQGDALDDQRALQIALDQLSLLDLDNDENPLYDNNQEPRKKSVNMTECVPVPSSEHVAEIVGRQGACASHSMLNVVLRCSGADPSELLCAQERGSAHAGRVGTQPNLLNMAKRITHVVVVAQRYRDGGWFKS